MKSKPSVNQIAKIILLASLLVSEAAVAAPPNAIQSWGYQLQQISVEEVAASTLDLVVIDYSKDGTDQTAFTSDEVAAMKANNKKVVAYFSIGEAEEYRYYFRRRWVNRLQGDACGRSLTSQAPTWLDKPNRNWCGNYKVRYWQRAWKKIIFGVSAGPRKSYLDRIIDAGFDGVYLDIVDAYQYRTFRKELGGAKPTARRMAKLVIAISRYARETRSHPNFMIIPQNGAGIIEKLSPELREEYFSSIDGIGAEDTFFYGAEDENNELNEQAYVVALLQQFQTAGKLVFSIEYLSQGDKIASYAIRACELGFIPQVAPRALDSLSDNVISGCIG